MQSSEVGLLWHKKGEFYNVRLNKGAGTLSASINRLRKKIYHAKADWKNHIVLTFDHESLKKAKQGGINSSELKYFFKKMRDQNKDLKYMWKYEEGGEKGRPHFHLLFDKTFSKKEIAKELKLSPTELQRKIRIQKNYEKHKNRTDNEVAMGLLLNKKWGKGITWCVNIKNEYQLHNYVESDIAKSTTKQHLKEKARMWGFSRGMQYHDDDPSEYEFVERCSRKFAFKKIKETKDNFIEWFNQEYDGWQLWKKTVKELMDGLTKQERIEFFVGNEQEQDQMSERMKQGLRFLKDLRAIYKENETDLLEFQGVKETLCKPIGEYEREFVEQKFKFLLDTNRLVKLKGKMLKLKGGGVNASTDL